MIQSSTIKFLQELAINNNKPWFDANRKTYEATKANFLTFTKQVLQEMASIDDTLIHLQPKDCIFRINRDVRFSKNKDPYKTNMGMSIAKGGKGGMFAGYYFHLEPQGKSFVGGGLYMPMPEQLKKVRQEIDYCWDEFYEIINNAHFVQAYGSLEQTQDLQLTRPPKGYDATHAGINYIKLKSWIATTQITDEQVLQANLIATLVNQFKALTPLIHFLNKAIE